MTGPCSYGSFRQMKTCFLFPGQGAQSPGMGRDLWEHSARVREIFEAASAAAAFDVRALIFEGTEEELQGTDRAQIAITTVNLAASAVLRERGLSCDGAAGFSLGEYAALYEAGVIALEDLFPIVTARGEAMAAASDALRTDAGPAGMAAVLGLDYSRIKELCETRLRDVYVANYNSPTQTVLSGTAEGLAEADRLCKEAGAKRFIALKVSGPFHSPLIDGARAELKRHLEAYTFRDPRLPVYSNVTGAAIRTGAEAKELCVRQIVSTVRWVDDERAVLADGFTRCVEAGPGRVLTGLWKSVGETVPCAPAGTIEQIEALVEDAREHA